MRGLRLLLTFPLNFDVFQRGCETRLVSFLFKPDLLRCILAHKTALCGPTKKSDRRKAFIQVLSDSHCHREAPALLNW
jgi:hypothetical protein